MGFCDYIEHAALPVRQAILAHPFVAGVGDGTLPMDKFKHYVLQDYLYLIDYSRVLALASARAPDLESMGWFAKLLDETLNTEMELHRSYCAEFGITREELDATRGAPTTVGYTSYLLKVAYQGTFPELVAGLLPCQWGYWEIGEHLAGLGKPVCAPAVLPVDRNVHVGRVWEVGPDHKKHGRLPWQPRRPRRANGYVGGLPDQPAV